MTETIPSSNEQSFDLFDETASEATFDVGFEPPKKIASLSPSRDNRAGIARTESTFICHTNLANQFFFGRQGDQARNIRAITGLVGFTSRLNKIYDMAKQDDPYADNRLIAIEQALDLAYAFVKEQYTYVNALLCHTDNLIINPSTSIEPVKHRVEFKTRLANYGLRVLCVYDKLVRSALAAHHMDVMSDADWRATVSVSGKKLRHAFALSDNFRASGTTRQDFAAKNQRAQDAIAKYGELEQDVLEGTLRASRAPRLMNTSPLSMLNQ